MLAGRRAEYGEGIVATLSQQLSWSHFREILPLKRLLQREYYAEMCRVERWSVRALRERIDSMRSRFVTASKGKASNSSQTGMSSRVSGSQLRADRSLLARGGCVSRKLQSAEWGDGVVAELARYIARRQPGVSGFSRPHQTTERGDRAAEKKLGLIE